MELETPAESCLVEVNQLFYDLSYEKSIRLSSAFNQAFASLNVPARQQAFLDNFECNYSNRDLAIKDFEAGILLRPVSQFGRIPAVRLIQISSIPLQNPVGRPKGIGDAKKRSRREYRLKRQACRKLRAVTKEVLNKDSFIFA
jgi:hypothetical protein